MPATPPPPSLTPSQPPSQLYFQTLTCLHTAQSKISTAAFKLALSSQPDAVQQKAQLDYLKLTNQISALEDAVLSKIAAQMQAQEKDLTQATTFLTSALADLTKVASILDGIEKAITVVAKILPAVAAL